MLKNIDILIEIPEYLWQDPNGFWNDCIYLPKVTDT